MILTAVLFSLCYLVFYREWVSDEDIVHAVCFDVARVFSNIFRDATTVYFCVPFEKISLFWSVNVLHTRTAGNLNRCVYSSVLANALLFFLYRWQDCGIIVWMKSSSNVVTVQLLRFACNNDTGLSKECLRYNLPVSYWAMGLVTCFLQGVCNTMCFDTVVSRPVP